ncbi:MAG: hypothetical protein GQ475_06245 [Methylococcaceae bacterium]|nr:hypothetical protein [Methylococcaceae bacterium]
MKFKSYVATFLLVATSTVFADRVDVDFSNVEAFPVGPQTIQVNNIRVDTVIDNPFDPAHPTIVSTEYNIPFTFNIQTLQFAPSLNGVAANDNSRCATANVTVINAFTGQSIPNAMVSIADQSVLTNSLGQAQLLNLVQGLLPVSVSSANFNPERQAFLITCDNTNELSLSINPVSGEGALTAGEARIILSWGQHPSDLDSHLTGPTLAGGDDRFHVYFGSDITDVASLDVDDTSSYGPETITITPETVGGESLRPGLYRYSVHHFSGAETISTSEANVRLILADGTERNFTPPLNAVGDDDLWTVFEFLIDNAGVMTIFPVNTVESNVSSFNVRSVITSTGTPSSTGYGSVEDGIDWAELPIK